MLDIKLIQVGTKLTDSSNVDWRVFSMDQVSYSLIKLGTKGRFIITYAFDNFVKMLINNEFSISFDQEVYMVDETKLPEKVKAVYEKKKAFVLDIKQAFGPYYKQFLGKYCSLPEYRRICLDHGYDSTKASRILNKWFQSGFQNSALVEERYYKDVERKAYQYSTKTGRKGDTSKGMVLGNKDYEYIDDIISTFLKNPEMSKSQAYTLLLQKYYTVINENHEIQLCPIDERPTMDQFVYYVKTRVSSKDLKTKKTSKSEYYNNERVLNSTTIFGTTRPGDILEADALEVDLEIVSHLDRTLGVGKPILYMLIDVYSRCIVAAYVSFNNNANIALSGLISNLFEDKITACRRHGLIFNNPELWPSQFIPKTIRTDGGSDFESIWFEEVCRRLNIELQHEPPAMGSMKGNIERSFRSFHDTMRSSLYRSGMIRTAYSSNHKREACLTIYDVYALVVNFILYHNTTERMKQSLTRDMVINGVRPSPISLWNYGVSKNGEPEYILPTQRQQIYFNIMQSGKATISRTEQIKWNGLHYMPNKELDFTLISRLEDAKSNAGKINRTTGDIKNSMEIRFDPCCIDYIFYEHNGRIIPLELSPTLNGAYKDLQGMTLEEYEHYKKEVKEVRKGTQEQRLLNSVISLDNVLAVKNNAMSETYADTDRIKENRKAARNDLNRKEKAVSRMGYSDAEVPSLVSPSVEKTEEKKEETVNPMIEPVVIESNATAEVVEEKSIPETQPVNTDLQSDDELDYASEIIRLLNNKENYK